MDIWKYGTELVEDHLSRGIKFLGTICPWGPFVQGDQFHGDHLSRGKGSGGPEVQESNGLGTKCVAAGFFYISGIVGVQVNSQLFLKKDSLNDNCFDRINEKKFKIINPCAERHF